MLNTASKKEKKGVLGGLRWLLNVEGWWMIHSVWLGAPMNKHTELVCFPNANLWLHNKKRLKNLNGEIWLWLCAPRKFRCKSSCFSTQTCGFFSPTQKPIEPHFCFSQFLNLLAALVFFLYTNHMSYEIYAFIWSILPIDFSRKSYATFLRLCLPALLSELWT